jgi:hypothetical protein
MCEYWKLKLKTQMFEFGCVNTKSWKLKIEMFKYWKLKSEMFESWKMKTKMSRYWKF